MYFDPDKITFFGRTDARGKNVAFGIKAKDRQRHVYVIGKTGMGKSTLLENMAVQDIQNGEGMAFIDPHGSAAETLLNYIPEHRIKDVLYFSPADVSFPISFNIMEDVGPDKRHLVVSGLMSVFKKIWVDAWSARMEYILQNTILALLEFPGSTLVGVNRMLSDKAYRDMIIANVKDPSVKSFWIDEFNKYNERYMQEAGDAIKNKIGQFTANPSIRNIIGQPKSSFNIRQMMDEKKIIIMNLSKGLIGETNANLLGSMLTTHIYLAAMSRADLSPEKMKEMPNFYFYVDEFQSFANATFANILSEARKYHLNLTIAHQYIEQMEEDVRNAVFGNVGTIISFRVGPFDAEVLETIFTPQFLAADIVNLGFAQVYLTLMIDGIGSPPFSATTLPPIAAQSVSYKDVVIAASRSSYARPRAEVEIDIAKFHEPVIPPRKERPVRVEEGSGEKKYVAPARDEAPRERKEAPRREEGGERAASNGHSDRERRPVGENAGERRQPSQDHGERRQSERRGVPRREDEGSRERQSERKAQVKEPVPSPKKDSEDHLSELRSILKKVVSDVEKKETAAQPKESALKVDVPELVQPPISESTPLPPTPPPSPIPQRADDAREVLKQSINRIESDGEKAQGVTAKELERMMRVTGSDKL